MTGTFSGNGASKIGKNERKEVGKMKRCFVLMLALAMLLSAALAEETALPAYVYQGDEPMMAAICDYLLETQAGYFGEADVAIPCPVVLETDDADPEDIRVWGEFSLFNYNLLNTTLVLQSGGIVPGLLHLKAAGEDFEVVSAEWVEDGEDYGAAVERIFGAREGLVRKLENIAEASEEAMLRSVSDYVRWNGLPITQYQEFGWLPVPLIGAAETAEADQIVHLESALGYALDYDLRAFSFASFGEEEEGLSGVGDLEGISLDVARYADRTAEEVVQQLAGELAEPVTEAAQIGAEGLEATCVRDGALREDVDRSTYVLPLADGGCLAVSLSNTYYAMEGDQVVVGADEALAAVLGTLRVL